MEYFTCNPMGSLWKILIVNISHLKVISSTLKAIVTGTTCYTAYDLIFVFICTSVCVFSVSKILSLLSHLSRQISPNTPSLMTVYCLWTLTHCCEFVLLIWYSLQYSIQRYDPVQNLEGITLRWLCLFWGKRFIIPWPLLPIISLLTWWHLLPFSRPHTTFYSLFTVTVSLHCTIFEIWWVIVENCKLVFTPHVFGAVPWGDSIRLSADFCCKAVSGSGNLMKHSAFLPGRH